MTVHDQLPTSRAPRTATPTFGDVLRTYRRGAGQPQLEAALAAGISQRHLSFLETGRSHPSRGVVLALGGTLGLSLAQQNEMLLAAGYAPMFRPEGRDRRDLEMIEQALLAFLDTHEPFPAVLLEDGVIIKKGNRGAARLWSAVRGVPIPEVPRQNVFDVMLRRGPGRERLENWSEATACLLRRYMAEQARVRRPEHVETTAALARNPEVKRLLRQDPGVPPPPVLLLKYHLDDGTRLNLFVVIASLQAPLDTRVEDLRVELFIPADSETSDWFRR
jgi:transcriptional regulator with XRE-family HTH domain